VTNGTLDAAAGLDGMAKGTLDGMTGLDAKTLWRLRNIGYF